MLTAVRSIVVDFVVVFLFLFVACFRDDFGGVTTGALLDDGDCVDVFNGGLDGGDGDFCETWSALNI